MTSGAGYYIDEFAGVGRVETNTPEMWKEVGILLARIHKIPVEWWDGLKTRWISEEPLGSSIPAGSLGWVYLSRGAW